MEKADYVKKLEAKVKKGNQVFIAPNATVLGNVALGDNASVWYQAVIRGDSDAITIGSRTNVQDSSIIHVDPNVPVNIGHDVILGHSAIVHGATVGDHSLIGMRSTVLNNARIGNFCIVGAHSLVTEGKEFPDYSLIMGSPAKVVRQLTDEDIQSVKQNAETYVQKGLQYLGED